MLWQTPTVMILLSLLFSAARCLAAERPAPRIEPSVPVDVEIPEGFPAGENPIAFFDDLSWRTFVALNWPAVSGERGEPDRNKALGTRANAVVWETWKADHELFQPEGQRPSRWSSFASASSCRDLAVDDAGAAKILGGTGDAQGLAIDHFNQASFGPPIGTLIAQNRTYTRYEIRINRAEYDFIRGDDAAAATWFYLRGNLPLGEEPSLVFPAGSVEVKAAWKEFRLPAEDALLPRYYTRNATVVAPDGTCTKRTVGLVGLHVVHRTPTHREWIWSTFEHVDNLLDAAGDVAPSFTRRDGSQDPLDPLVNKLKPVVDSDHPPADDPEPVQVVRVKPIHESTAATNREYRGNPKIKDTVWANYQLVMTQWPTRPAGSDEELREQLSLAYPEGAGAPFPVDSEREGTAIANVTMETTGAFQRSVSCMRCHQARSANLPKTEFVWFLRLRAYPSSGEAARAITEDLRSFSAERMNRLDAP